MNAEKGEKMKKEINSLLASEHAVMAINDTFQLRRLSGVDAVGLKVDALTLEFISPTREKLGA